MEFQIFLGDKMNKIYRVVIVGGGAAGLMSAVELLRGQNALLGQDVLILERNDRVGKKLSATGNGQGNLTNAHLSSENYNGDKGFINAFLSMEKKINLEDYLRSIGIVLCEQKDGKKYPVSRQANAVVDIIRYQLDRLNCQIQVGAKVERIKKEKGVFVLGGNFGEVYAEKVILAVGGNAGKQFGTDGQGYSLAQEFGHELTNLYPSLVQLKCDLKDIRGLKGLKEIALVTALDKDRKLKSAVGDILFTEYGISGSSVFEISGKLANAKNPVVNIEFLPEYSLENLIELIKERQRNLFIEGEDMLVGIVNKKIGQAVVKSAKSSSVKDVCTRIKNFTVKVTGNLGFNYAQVTRGGIKTDKIDKETMQSSLASGLYLVGEMLDVDGDCGGYNLTFAFISAITAAKDIKTNNQGETC